MTGALPDRGILGLWDLDTADERRRLVPAAAMVLLTWVAIITYLGPLVGSDVAAAMTARVPRNMLFGGVATALGLSIVVAWSRGAYELAALAAVLGAYVGGTVMSGAAYRALDAWALDGWQRFVTHRLAYGVTVLVPLLAVCLLWPRLRRRLVLRVGSWRGVTRFFTNSETPASWRVGLLALVVTVGIPFFLVMQVAVGFAPIRSGDVVLLAGPIALMALVNASVEEAIFRGVLQGAMIECAGTGRGLWLQGLFFGLHHFGLSVSVLGTLPAALLIGVGSVLFGKSVLETRGLGWAIAAHAVFDVGVFAAVGPRF